MKCYLKQTEHKTRLSAGDKISAVNHIVCIAHILNCFFICSLPLLNYPPLIGLTVWLKWGILVNRAHLTIVAYNIVRGFSYGPSYPRSPCGSCWIFLKLTLVCAILQLICFCWHLYLYRDVRGKQNTSNPLLQGISCHLDGRIQNISDSKDTICLFLRLFYRTISLFW